MLSFSSRPRSLRTRDSQSDERRTPITQLSPGPGSIRERGGSGRAREHLPKLSSWSHHLSESTTKRNHKTARRMDGARERDGARRAKSHLLFEFKISFLALIYTHGDSSYFLTAFKNVALCLWLLSSDRFSFALQRSRLILNISPEKVSMSNRFIIYKYPRIRWCQSECVISDSPRAQKLIFGETWFEWEIAAICQIWHWMHSALAFFPSTLYLFGFTFFSIPST